MSAFHHTATVCLLAYGLMASVAGAQTVQLAPKFRLGISDYLEQERIVTQTVGANALFGPERTTKSRHIRCMKRQIVAGLKGAETRIELTYDRVVIETETYGRQVAYDTDFHDATPGSPEANNPAAAVAIPMHGRSITVHVGADGRVRAVTGMDKILEVVEESAAGKFLFAPLMNEFTGQGARFTWADSRFALYAYRPVGVGDTWRMTVHHQDVFQGALTYNYECRLDRFEENGGRKQAFVTYAGTIEPKANSAPSARLFNILSTLTSGSFTGSATFDVQRCEFVRQSTNWKLTLASSITSGDAGESVNFPQQIETVETFRLLTPEQRRAQRDAASATNSDQTP